MPKTASEALVSANEAWLVSFFVNTVKFGRFSRDEIAEKIEPFKESIRTSSNRRLLQLIAGKYIYKSEDYAFSSSDIDRYLILVGNPDEEILRKWRENLQFSPPQTFLR